MCRVNSKPGYFKRSFANFLADFDAESFKVHGEKKKELLKDLRGQVLEIGPGTGVNFPFMNSESLEWSGLEPNPAMHSYLLKAAHNNDIQANLLAGTTEAIPMESGSMDFVISTEVLCSVGDLSESLKEIHRVLKPGGRFLFLEHVVDKHNSFRRSVQKTVPYTPWAYFSDGCRPGRDIGKAIEDAGFGAVQYQEYMQEGIGVIITINRPHIYGWALK